MSAPKRIMAILGLVRKKDEGLWLVSRLGLGVLEQSRLHVLADGPLPGSMY